MQARINSFKIINKSTTIKDVFFCHHQVLWEREHVMKTVCIAVYAFKCLDISSSVCLWSIDVIPSKTNRLDEIWMTSHSVLVNALNPNTLPHNYHSQKKTIERKFTQSVEILQHASKYWLGFDRSHALPISVENVGLFRSLCSMVYMIGF